jgi:hypothetical protein
VDIHKPKPIRNWRDFLKEYAIIVIGVATALAAEQGVEWWHWKNRVRDATEAMRLELREDDGPQAYGRIAMVNCYAGQLDTIQAAIEAERPRKEIAALTYLYRPPVPTWDSSAWNAVLSSDVGSHVTPTQMMDWSKPYNFIPAIEKRNQQEREDRLLLQPTHSKGEKLSSGEAETILAAIVRLRENNYGVSGFSGALLRTMKDNGILMGEDEKNYILNVLRKQFHDCVVTPSLVRTITPGRFPALLPPQSFYRAGR